MSTLDLTLADIYNRLSSGIPVSATFPDKAAAERFRLYVLTYKTRAERFNIELGLPKLILSATVTEAATANAVTITLELTDKRKQRAAPKTFTILPNPEIDS